MTGLKMKYFVLKPKGELDDAYANASRIAMKAYAKAIEDENHMLAHDLRKWVIEEQGKANEADLMRRLEEGDGD